MEMSSNRANEESSPSDQDDQVNNNLNGLGDPESRRKFLPFSLKIKRFKNKYFQRSIHSIIFIIIFTMVTLVNFYGIEWFFSIISKNKSEENIDAKFEIRPNGFKEELIQINVHNWEQHFIDVKNYLKQKSSQNCDSTNDFFCHITNETKNSECSEERTFGLRYGDPCILVDMKPVSKWITSNMTLDLRVHLKCDGVSSVDKELVGPIHYYPRNGIPLGYFMSPSNSSIVSPFIFVHLNRPSTGVLFFVECHVFRESIEEMKFFDQQSVKFQIIVDF